MPGRVVTNGGAPRRFLGGVSDRERRPPGQRRLPQYTTAAALLVWRALHRVCGHRYPAAFFVAAAAGQGGGEAEWLSAIRGERGTAAAKALAASIVRRALESARGAEPTKKGRSRKAQMFLASCRRVVHEYESVQQLQMPTVPLARTVAEYESADPQHDARRDSSKSRRLQQWIEGWPRVTPGPAIVAPQRAMARVREEREGRLGAAFAEALLHREVAPTQTRKPSDHLFWYHRREFLTLEEQARVAGLPDGYDQPLWRALGAEGGLSVIRATSALGGGVHFAAAADVLRLLLGDAAGEAGVLTYASMFSGIDMVAAAFDAIRGGREWRYAFAAESDTKLRHALLAAWGPLSTWRAACRASAT